MNHDKPLVAILIGAISAIPFEIVSLIAKQFGFVKYSLYQLDSLMITGNRPNYLLGFITSSIIASLIAFVFYYALGKIGSDHLVIKSLCISLFSWSFLEVVMTLTMEGIKIPQRPISSYYTHLIGSLIFGFTVGVLFNRYLVEKTAKEHSNK